VWAECRDLIYKNSVLTSQKTHHVSATKTIRLMLFGEIMAVYCENYMKHINTLCGKNAATLYVYRNSVRTSQETSRLRYKDQPVNVVCCKNHTVHTNTLCAAEC
jgi:hypothetical protein